MPPRCGLRRFRLVRADRIMVLFISAIAASRRSVETSGKRIFFDPGSAFLFPA